MALGLAVLTQRTNVLEVGSWKPVLRLGEGLDGFGIKRLGLSLLSFCVGLSMMLWYNLTTPGTIGMILSNLVVTAEGVNNLAFLTNTIYNKIIFNYFIIIALNRNSCDWFIIIISIFNIYMIYVTY